MNNLEKVGIALLLLAGIPLLIAAYLAIWHVGDPDVLERIAASAAIPGIFGYGAWMIGALG